MKNYLIITLGTRDVQLRKDLIEQSGEFEIQQNGRNTLLVQGDTKLAVFWNENFPLYYMISPREGGEIIENNPEIFAPYLEFPLIEDVLSQLITTEKIDYLLIVFTDQEKDWLNGKIKIKKNYADDTLYFKDIVWRTLKHNHKWKNVTFDEYVVETDVANIDYQYAHFKEVKSELFLVEPEEIGQIFLLPQGGIDQINHAITLQLLQAFKSKVKLFQKAEGNVPRQLQFTNYFLRDLIKHQIIALVEEGDYKASLELKGVKMSNNSSPKGINNQLLAFAFYRFNLLFDESNRIAKTILQSGFENNVLQSVANYESLLSEDVCPPNFKVMDWYRAGELFEKTRFYTKKDNFSEAVLAFHNFLELLLNGLLDSFFGTKLTSKYEQYALKVLQHIQAQFPSVYQSYNTNGNVILSIPLKIDVILAHQECNGTIKIFLQLVKPFIKSKGKELATGQKFLNDARNQFAHEGKFIKQDDVPYFKNLISNLETMMGNDRVSIYHQINELIKNAL